MGNDLTVFQTLLTSFKYFAQPIFILSRFSFLSFQFIIIGLNNYLAPLMQLNYNFFHYLVFRAVHFV